MELGSYLDLEKRRLSQKLPSLKYKYEVRDKCFKEHREMIIRDILFWNSRF
jgi:hypothetical protein